jgi:hypothetical protein
MCDHKLIWRVSDFRISIKNKVCFEDKKEIIEDKSLELKKNNPISFGI